MFGEGHILITVYSTIQGKSEVDNGKQIKTASVFTVASLDIERVYSVGSRVPRIVTLSVLNTPPDDCVVHTKRLYQE